MHAGVSEGGSCEWSTVVHAQLIREQITETKTLPYLVYNGALIYFHLSNLPTLWCLYPLVPRDVLANNGISSRHFYDWCMEDEWVHASFHRTPHEWCAMLETLEQTDFKQQRVWKLCSMKTFRNNFRAGWKKSLDGTWVRDSDVEFDSDDEPPDLPWQIWWDCQPKKTKHRDWSLAQKRRWSKRIVPNLVAVVQNTGCVYDGRPRSFVCNGVLDKRSDTPVAFYNGILCHLFVNSFCAHEMATPIFPPPGETGFLDACVVINSHNWIWQFWLLQFVCFTEE